MQRILLAVLSAILLSACASSVDITSMSAVERWQRGVFVANTPIEDDSRIHQGQLPNGLRYVMVPNQTPKNEIAMRLHVDAGSLDEQDGELGLAHLLEHMAFNGSTNVPEGEMVAILERYGLKFGADTNATTSFHETVYRLDLPNNGTDIIDTALFLLRETASNLTIAESALAAELPVVLAEYDARNTHAFRAAQAHFNAYTEGARYASRWAIGDKAQLNNMTAAQLRAFYERYYVPTNMTLVIVGDFTLEDMQRQIDTAFADWSPSADTAPDEVVGTPLFRESVGYQVHQGPTLSTQVAITLTTPSRKAPDSVNARRERYLQAVANGILNYRLQSLTLTGEAPFEGAQNTHFSLFDELEITSVQAVTSPQRWREALTALVVEIIKIQEYGVTWDEADRQITAIRNGLFTLSSERDTLPTLQLASVLLNRIEHQDAILDPRAELALFEELMATFTLADINTALLQQFSRVEPLVFVQSDLSTALSTADVEAVFEQAIALEVKPDEQAAQVTFAYADFGEPGEIISNTHEPQHDVTSVVFANGVHLNIKPTSLVTGQVLLDLQFGQGYRAFNAADVGLKELYAYKVVAGLGQHDINELRQLLSGKDVTLGFEPRFHAWGGVFSTAQEHLGLQLQLMAAFMTDAAWDPQLYNLYVQNTQQQYAQAKTSVDAVRSVELGNVLYDNDVRVSVPRLEQALSRNFSDMADKLQQQLDNGPVMLSIVGDVDVDEVIALVAESFGALALDVEAPKRSRVSDLMLQTGQQHILKHEGNSQNAVAIRVYKTADNHDKRLNNTLNILSEILKLKVTQKIREELGAAYSPVVFNTQARYVKDDGYIQFDTQTTPEQLAAVFASYDEIINQVITDNGISDDEMRRAVAPLLASVQQAVEQNGFWLNRLALLHIEPNAIDRWYALPALLESITKEDVRNAARQYLVEAGKIEAVIIHQDQASDDLLQSMTAQ
jgi:zinc protease